MSLLDEAKRDAALEAAAEKEAYNFDEAVEEPVQEGVRISMPDFSFLLAPTGEGSVENYLDHVLNYDGEKSTARILRGLTGFAGELNYAIIDIGLGLMEKLQGKRKAKENEFNFGA